MRLASFVALIFLSLGVAGYAIAVYGFLPLGVVVHPDMRATFETQRTGIYAHVFASVVALAARLGFACLALGWLYTGWRAYLAIRARDIVSHRRWMVRNFALTFAAVTLRLWLPASMASGIAFELAYPEIAWLCWVPNLLVAELLFNQKHNEPLHPTVGRGTSRRPSDG